jgi:hypothetical protein
MLQPGDKVSLRRTGEKGIVMGILTDGRLEVVLDKSGMEVPYYPDELVRQHIEPDLKSIEQSLKQPQAVSSPQPVAQQKEPQQAEPAKPTDNTPARLTRGPLPPKSAITETGFLFALVPDFDPMGQVAGYRLWLVNDMRRHFLLEGQFDGVTFSAVLQPGACYSPHRLYMFECDHNHPLIWQLTELFSDDSKAELGQGQIKIRSKLFTTQTEAVPALHDYGHVHILHDGSEPKPQEESLAEYTRKHTKKPVAPAPVVRVVPKIDPVAYAEFVREIDLHIEHLVPDPAKLDVQETLNVQLAAFDKYVARAIYLGVDQVTVIHGKGAGKLRSEVQRRLRAMPEVAQLTMTYKGMLNDGVTVAHFKR